MAVSTLLGSIRFLNELPNLVIIDNLAWLLNELPLQVFKAQTDGWLEYGGISTSTVHAYTNVPA